MIPGGFFHAGFPVPLLAQQSGPAGLGNMMLPMLVIFAIMYFMLIRPQQRKERERQKLIEAVKSGDRVMFSGGILGTVVNVKEGILVIRVAEGVKIEVARGAVSRVLTKDEKPVGGTENA